MDTLKIVEYDKKYAPAIARMWNRSGDCWGGYNLEMTPSRIEQEEASSPHLNLYLALDGEEVVGYCKLSEYRDDEAALYIDLLNVVPAYQKRKIGKALVKKCVERTAELGWPRVDLYTWPGNTKAVPLYKKCGFFWENSDDSTHLMDFIPTVLNTDLIRDYFQQVDWYQDSTRKIEVVPDGERRNDGEFYRYSWSNGIGNLSVEFCRYGRTISGIETDDWSIGIRTDRRKLVFGKSYPVYFDLKNKSGKPLQVEICGKDDKNIAFALQRELSLEKDSVVEGEFLVGVVDQEQNIRRTHPRVLAEVSINGRQARLGLGIEPRFPLNLDFAATSHEIFRPGRENHLFLNLENNFSEPAHFSWKMPESPLLEWLEEMPELQLQAEERKCVSVPFRFRSSGIYHPTLTVLTRPASGEEFTFQKETAFILANSWEPYTGQTKKGYVMGYGLLRVSISTTEHPGGIRFSKTGFKDNCFYLSPVQLGLPFSDEFSKKQPDSVEMQSEPGYVEMIVKYSSEKFRDTALTLYLRLHPDGILQTRARIDTTGNTPGRELIINRRLSFPRKGGYLPYRGEIREMGLENQFSPDYLNCDLIDENWLITKGLGSSLALFWEGSGRLKLSDWQFMFEDKIKVTESSGHYETPAVYLAIDRFRDWRCLREYVQEQAGGKAEALKVIAVTLNGGNPFFVDKLSVKIEECRQRSFSGTFRLSSSAGAVPAEEHSLPASANSKQIDWETAVPGRNISATINLDLELPLMHFRESRAVFQHSGQQQPIKRTEEYLEDMQVFQLSNGRLTARFAVDYFPGLFSLALDGEEWLAHSWPQRCCRSWWAEWGGGINALPEDMRYKTILVEKHAMEWVERTDNFGNPWQGVKIISRIERDERYRGLSWQNFYLMLPQCPVLLLYSVIDQQTGKFLRNWNFETSGFLGHQTENSRNYAIMRNETGQEFRIKAGLEELWLEQVHSLAFGSETSENIMQVYADNTDCRTELSTDRETTSFWMNQKLHLQPGRSYPLPPRFFLFSSSFQPDRELADLKNIRFGIENETEA